MLVRLLGPVDVTDDEGRVVALGRRERAFVAMLALTPGATVTDADLVAGLWDSPPEQPAAALARLAQRIRDDARALGVLRSSDGWWLDAEPVEVDGRTFGDLVARARDLAPADARDALDRALGLWRGTDALADLRDVPFANGAARRLEAARLAAVEDRNEMTLQLGEHAELVDDLRDQVRDHPGRERLWGQLMTALHRSHRTEEAIGTYATARTTLVDELGIEPSEALHQIEAAILRHGQENEPAERDADPRPVARIPVPRTRTVGREALCDRVLAAVTDPHRRLVTLSGLGGSGKTRVAVVVARALQDDGHEVYFVPAVDGTTADALAGDIAVAVGVPSPDDPVAALADLDAERRVLVVIDNLESVDAPGPVLRRILDAAPGLSFLATSRLPLRLSGEYELPVPPLAVPPAGAAADVVRRSPAVELFTLTAATTAPDFQITGHEDDVAAVCRLLDGVPLAVELAAARLRVLGLAGILTGLRSSLDLVSTGSDEVPSRQRALTTTIAWSHEHLPAPARAVAERLAVFERGFTLEAVEAVCSDLGGVVDALTAVMEAGLIRGHETRVEIGYVMPPPVRSWMRGRLRDTAVEGRVRDALAGYLLGLVHSWSGDLDGPDGRVALGRFDDEVDDVTAAVDWCLAAGRIGTGVDLVLAAGPFLLASGRLQEGAERVNRALDAVPPRAREAGRLHTLAGQLAYQLGELPVAEQHLVAAIEVGDAAVDEESATTARCYLAAILLVTRRVDDGTVLAKVAVEAADRLDLYPLGAEALATLAMSHALAGNFTGEREAHQQRLELAQAHDDVARTAHALNVLAEIALDEADAETAQQYAERSLQLAEGTLPLEARDALITLARTSIAAGRLSEAADVLGRAVPAAERTGRGAAYAQCLRVAGCLAAAHGEAALAVRLFSAGHRLVPSPTGTDLPAEFDLASGLEEARGQLDEAQARAAWTLGRANPATDARADLGAALALAR